MLTKRSRKDYFFVGIQIILFLIYGLSPSTGLNLDFPDELKYGSLGLCLLGLIFSVAGLMQLKTNLTPWPTPISGAYLVQHGTYRLVRHPVYAGLILFLVTYALYRQNAGKLAVAGALIVLFYFKSKYEEALLTSKFPEYAVYQLQVGRFWPKIF